MCCIHDYPTLTGGHGELGEQNTDRYLDFHWSRHPWLCIWMDASELGSRPCEAADTREEPSTSLLEPEQVWERQLQLSCQAKPFCQGKLWMFPYLINLKHHYILGNRRWQILIPHISQHLHEFSTFRDSYHTVDGKQCRAAFVHKKPNTDLQWKLKCQQQ